MAHLGADVDGENEDVRNVDVEEDAHTFPVISNHDFENFEKTSLRKTLIEAFKAAMKVKQLKRCVSPKLQLKVKRNRQLV